MEQRINMYRIWYKPNTNTVTPVIDRKLANGKRFRKALGHLKYSNKKNLSPQERIHKKNMQNMANSILQGYNDELLGIATGRKTYDLDDSFVHFLEHKLSMFTDEYRVNTKLDAVIKIAKAYNEEEEILFKQVMDYAWLNGFKHYLQNKHKKKNGKKLAVNTQSAYLRKLKLYIYEACNEGKIPSHSNEDVEPIKETETEKLSLTSKELEILINDPTSYTTPVKKAFVFCCLTGLRYGDIKDLQFQDISEKKHKGKPSFFIKRRMNKTKDFVEIFLDKMVLDLIEFKKGKKGLVFVGLEDYHRPKIKDWVQSKGIEKNVTFHCSRHTHATILVENKVDIYTIKELLGHKSIATTSIYLHTNEENLHNASRVIPNLINKQNNGETK